MKRPPKPEPSLGGYHRDNVPDDLPQPWARFWEMFKRARDTSGLER